MKGRTTMMKVAGLLTLLCSWSMAHGQHPEQKLAQAMKQNQAALQQYTWKSQTQIRKEGEIKVTKLFSNRYSANGEVVQLLIEEQSAKLPKFGIRGMEAKKKKEEAMELIDALQRFAKSYAELPPAKMQEFMKTAKVTLETNAPQPLLRLESGNVLQSGDSMVIWLDANTRRQPRIEINSSFDAKPVHMVNVGAVTVDVDNKDGRLSNAISVPIRRTIVPLNVFGWHPWVTRDVQLLLLAIFAGALGSIFHALKSLGDFIGNRTVIASWYWWYITRPFVGMALALIFYAVLRGGFVVGSPADAKVVNPFGGLAIGALVGMFAAKAAQKLPGVFVVVFRAADQRSGKLDAPVIDRIEPGTVTTGDTKPVVIRIIGDRLGKVVTVRLNSEERKPDTVAEKEITLRLKPEDVTTSGQIKVTVINPDGGASAAATLHISNLVITTTALPDAKVGIDYRQTMTMSGGTSPYKWSLVNPPKWLSIVESSGELQGKPDVSDAKDTPVTVKVVDKDGASASKALTLKVNP